jgi:hypothetical protein
MLVCFAFVSSVINLIFQSNLLYYAEYLYAKCRYADRHYAECRGATHGNTSNKLPQGLSKKLYSIGPKSCLCKIFTFETKASFIGASCQKLSPSFYPSQLGPIYKLIPTDI